MRNSFYFGVNYVFIFYFFIKSGYFFLNCRIEFRPRKSFEFVGGKTVYVILNESVINGFRHYIMFGIQHLAFQHTVPGVILVIFTAGLHDKLIHTEQNCRRHGFGVFPFGFIHRFHEVGKTSRKTALFVVEGFFQKFNKHVGGSRHGKSVTVSYRRVYKVGKAFGGSAGSVGGTNVGIDEIVVVIDGTVSFGSRSSKVNKETEQIHCGFVFGVNAVDNLLIALVFLK